MWICKWNNFSKKNKGYVNRKTCKIIIKLFKLIYNLLLSNEVKLQSPYSKEIITLFSITQKVAIKKHNNKIIIRPPTWKEKYRKQNKTKPKGKKEGRKWRVSCRRSCSCIKFCHDLSIFCWQFKCSMMCLLSYAKFVHFKIVRIWLSFSWQSQDCLSMPTFSSAAGFI